MKYRVHNLGVTVNVRKVTAVKDEVTYNPKL